MTGYSINREATRLKWLHHFQWLNEVPREILTHSILNMDNAYKRFFKGENKHPRFKRRNSKQSAYFHQKVFVRDGKVFFTGMRQGIRFRDKREAMGKIKSVTITRCPSGKYHAVVLTEHQVQVPQREGKTVGIDVGLNHFATLSTGEKIRHPKWMKRKMFHLKKHQRLLSRKKKGSANRDKQRLRVARIYEDIANARRGFHQSLTHKLVSENQVAGFVVEGLHVSGMVKNHRLAGAIADSGWAWFITFMKQKCEWTGHSLATAPTFFPSSKLCFVCGHKQDMPLHKRIYVCSECGHTMDRDLNASLNLVKYSRLGWSGVPVESGGLPHSVKQEIEQSL